LKNLEAYFVQDVFGAYDLLKSKGVQNLVPVGAIIDTTQRKESNLNPEFTFHLGGLINIFAKEPIEKYINGVCNIINEISAKKQSLILTSKNAIECFDILKNGAIPSKNISHNETLKIFAQSKIVFTSPGLTTLLELDYLQVPVIPLPPQNLSQALIINNIVIQWKEAPEIWKFLAQHYPITQEMDEEEGVKQIQEMNATHLYNSQFKNNFIRLLNNEILNHYNIMKLNIIDDFVGVQKITEIISKLKMLNIKYECDYNKSWDKYKSS
jgi:hypothetical protein